MHKLAPFALVLALTACATSDAFEVPDPIASCGARPVRPTFDVFAFENEPDRVIVERETYETLATWINALEAWSICVELSS